MQVFFKTSFEKHIFIFLSERRLFKYNMNDSYLSISNHKIKNVITIRRKSTLKKILFFILISFCLFLFFHTFYNKKIPLPVFHITEKPEAIVRGTTGSALTINISFGDEEVSDWIETLQEPYPLLLVDVDWAMRFPQTVDLIKKKKIPTGLLGDNGEAYKEDDQLILQQIESYEEVFNAKPLWFRTKDELFPEALHQILWKAQINALGSSLTWQGGDIPPMTDGEIIAVPHQLKERVDLTELNRLLEDRQFQPIDEVLFGTESKLKKIPNK